PRRLAGAAAQVLQLCTADLALADNSHLLNKGAVDREDTLDAHAVSDAADGKGLCDAAVLLGNDGALKGLDALALAFLDADVHPDGVADVELGALSLDAALGNDLQCVHLISSICFDVHARQRCRQRTACLMIVCH